MERFGYLALACIALTSGIAGAQAADPPQLHTHQSYIEEIQRPTTLDVKDLMATFGYVLNSLPDRVKIYPTENYFYFTFTHNGLPYAGNIRLDASDRDRGKVQFAYYEQTTGWFDETPSYFKTLDAADGVTLEKVERFLYRLSYGGKSVLFELNDLSQVRPPAGALAPKESFIGPSFDDSGVRFFLIYNAAIKNFLFILDETVKVTDEFVESSRDGRILTGKRTGFVFYRDHLRDRKILIGVYEENVRVNNYLDGPFDQLPDNFIEGEILRNAILEVDPKLKGKIDRFGGTPDGEVRYNISPYLIYKDERAFDPVDRCASRAQARPSAYYRCFLLDKSGPQDLNSRPTESETMRPENVRKQPAPEKPAAPN
jgi:hypothetical protein